MKRKTPKATELSDMTEAERENWIEKFRTGEITKIEPLRRPKTIKAARQSMETDGEVILRVIDVREINLGTQGEFRQAANEITDYTGGSSGGGAFSALWGILCDTWGHEFNVRPDNAERIAREAASFQSMCGDRLNKGANALLHRLASVGQKPAMAPSIRNRVVVAIGDLHGHYPALEQLLAYLRSKYDLFEHNDPDKLRRGVTLVFTGDYIDRGKHALAIIEKLRKIGATNPGHLVTLLGNHELLALEAYDTAVELSKWDNEKDAIKEYCNTMCHGWNGGDDFIREFGPHTLPALKSYAARMARSGDIGRWIRTELYPFFETKVARKKILFMHADLTKSLRDSKVLDRYLRQLKKWLEVGTYDVGGTAAKYGDLIPMGSRGIFWDRSYSWKRAFGGIDDADQDYIDNICKRVEVDFLVTGHTIHKTIKAYGNRIFDIDVGMHRENTPQALIFRSDGIVGFGVDGSETTFVRW